MRLPVWVSNRRRLSVFAVAAMLLGLAVHSIPVVLAGMGLAVVSSFMRSGQPGTNRPVGGDEGAGKQRPIDKG